MCDALDELDRWWQAGEPVGLATVVATWRSAPRQAGATMLVGPDGTAAGSVSGGCVESALYEVAQAVIATGTPILERYGVTDGDAFAVGLTCGGMLDVYVERIDARELPRVRRGRRGDPGRRPRRGGHLVLAENFIRPAQAGY